MVTWFSTFCALIENVNDRRLSANRKERFIEAYGLWHMRVWAEWFALLSGGIYLPWEILELIERPTRLHWALFLSNVVIVSYMLYIRVRASLPLKEELHGEGTTR